MFCQCWKVGKFLSFRNWLIIFPSFFFFLKITFFCYLDVVNLQSWCRIAIDIIRALKTRGNTPKYGLIFHSSFIGRASARNKGRLARYLANKCSIATRIDCFSGENLLPLRCNCFSWVNLIFFFELFQFWSSRTCRDKQHYLWGKAPWAGWGEAGILWQGHCTSEEPGCDESCYW